MFLKIGVLKGDLRPKGYSCFYDILLLILWGKRIIQSFVVFWSDFKKLWSHKVLNSEKWRHTRNVQKISPLVLFAFFVRFMEKKLLHSFMVFLYIFNELVKLGSFEWLNCIST